MKEFKGTPGPWRVEDNNSFFEIKSFDDEIGDVGASKHVFDDGRHRRGGIAEANAQLIAAAPDLLEALQDALHAYDKHGEDSSWDFARAIINKALGGPQ